MEQSYKEFAEKLNEFEAKRVQDKELMDAKLEEFEAKQAQFKAETAAKLAQFEAELDVKMKKITDASDMPESSNTHFFKHL